MTVETLIMYLAYCTTVTIIIMTIYYFICVINDNE
jgi:hypothetical protein